MTKVYASLIMRDECSNLEKCLTNIAPVVDGYCIQDNGSTDGSQDLARQVLDKIGKPYKITHSEWYNYGTNRNICIDETVEFAKNGFAIDLHSPITYEEYESVRDLKVYIFVTDIDNTLYGRFNAEELTDDGYYIESLRDNTVYKTQNLLKYDLLGYRTWKYARSVHEYASWCRTGLHYQVGMLEGCYINYGHKGIRSKDPYRCHKDLMYLAQDAKVYGDGVSHDARSRFYIAQTYKELGEFEASKSWYLIHAKDPKAYVDERYISYLTAAQLTNKTTNKDEYLSFLYSGMELGRKRLEIVHQLVTHFRSKENHHMAWCIASSFVGIDIPKGQLFMDSVVHEYSFYDGAGVAAYYAGEYRQSLVCCNLALKSDLMDDDTRKRINKNMEFAIAMMD